MTIPKIAEIKNEWLYQQVDVEYPTKESIAGLALYKAKVASCQYEQLESVTTESSVFGKDDIFLVDFHRLTVMFALLQARRWQNQADKDLILEFLSQIIYSEPCSLYLGFKAGEAVAAAIVTESEDASLISDIVVKDESAQLSKQDFVAALCVKLGMNDDSAHSLFVES
ncbi:flavodoxin [Vibrio tubiashii]|uniref:flavodoxin n=1 Tax=Vibrio tubiashii TaxID=29498 RepID=UPI001EFCC838|nr:flavodoxin [Vibrio tubiashii]MCG9580684.1 flavodoxin [Vibrio tubiashii]MCG9614275.1 flavodoxin [Vibrio tubiashii]MCG9689497.1 flavodoxin [Vibrio tubiashii]